MIWSADAPMLLSFLPMVLSKRSTSLPASGIRFAFWNPAPSSWKSKTVPTSTHLQPTSSPFHLVLLLPVHLLCLLVQLLTLPHSFLLTLLHMFLNNQFRILLRVQLHALLPNPTNRLCPLLHPVFRYLLLTHQYVLLHVLLLTLPHVILLNRFLPQIPVCQIHPPSSQPLTLAPLTVATSSAKRIKETNTSNSSDSLGVQTQDPILSLFIYKSTNPLRLVDLFLNNLLSTFSNVTS